MGIADTEIDFDFETGEIVEDPQYDVIDFCAKIEGYWRVAALTHHAKIPRSLEIPRVNQILLRKRGSEITFSARALTNTRRQWSGDTPMYVHESL